MKHKGLAAFFCAALSIIPLVSAQAQANPAALKAFPDFLSVRSEFLSSVITAAPVRALAFKSAYRDTPAGRVRVSVEPADTSFFVMFQLERGGTYPVGSRGNIVIKRETATGFIQRVVWYLSDDGMSFISLTPKNERTVVDYVVAGALSRGSYNVSRLIYYFFTNTFMYLYDTTRTGLDWSLLLGDPGPATTIAFAMELGTGPRTGAAAELIRSTGDFVNVGRYLEAAGHAVSVPEEETAPLCVNAASFIDPRDPALVSIPAWSEAGGLAIEATAAAMISGIASESAYIALVSSSGLRPSRRFVVVPYRNEAGSYVVAAFDVDVRQPIDFMLVVADMPGVTIRLFRVPLPLAR